MCGVERVKVQALVTLVQSRRQKQNNGFSLYFLFFVVAGAALPPPHHFPGLLFMPTLHPKISSRLLQVLDIF